MSIDVLTASTPHSPTKTANPGAHALRSALAQFDAAADLLGLEPGLRQVLRVPQREYTTNFPVMRDDGSTEVFTGWPALSPGHGYRRGSRPGDVDDLEVRPRERSIRRSEGRRHRRSTFIERA